MSGHYACIRTDHAPFRAADMQAFASALVFQCTELQYAQLVTALGMKADQGSVYRSAPRRHISMSVIAVVHIALDVEQRKVCCRRGSIPLLLVQKACCSCCWSDSTLVDRGSLLWQLLAQGSEDISRCPG